MFYTRTCVCVERARQGQFDATNVYVWLSACFCGLVNPRTVPQLSLIKFRAPLGYRGLVLGLNVSYFFRSLGISSGARAEQTQPTKVANSYVTKNCGQCWPIMDTCLCACMFFVVIVFLGVSVNAGVFRCIRLLTQHNRSNKLHCHLKQWRQLHNTLF